ncbi:MAG: hypothetical protein U1B78_04205, partial [Dehalococcoidia bacterium]|nr:hypothetical protein [Dehalococcoidia bacterium]
DGRFIVFGASPPGAPLVSTKPAYVRRGSRTGGGAAVRAARNGLPMDIYIMEAEGGAPRMIGDVDIDLPSIAWTADGGRIFVLGGRGTFAIDPDGGAEQLAPGTFHGQLDWLAPE